MDEIYLFRKRQLRVEQTAFILNKTNLQEAGSETRSGDF
jgi:hypothetical protein